MDAPILTAGKEQGILLACEGENKPLLIAGEGTTTETTSETTTEETTTEEPTTEEPTTEEPTTEEPTTEEPTTTEETATEETTSEFTFTEGDDCGYCLENNTPKYIKVTISGVVPNTLRPFGCMESGECVRVVSTTINSTFILEQVSWNHCMWYLGNAYTYTTEHWQPDYEGDNYCDNCEEFLYSKNWDGVPLAVYRGTDGRVQFVTWPQFFGCGDSPDNYCFDYICSGTPCSPCVGGTFTNPNSGDCEDGNYCHSGTAVIETMG